MLRDENPNPMMWFLDLVIDLCKKTYRALKLFIQRHRRED